MSKVKPCSLPTQKVRDLQAFRAEGLTLPQSQNPLASKMGFPKPQGKSASLLKYTTPHLITPRGYVTSAHSTNESQAVLLVHDTINEHGTAIRTMAPMNIPGIMELSFNTSFVIFEEVLWSHNTKLSYPITKEVPTFHRLALTPGMALEIPSWPTQYVRLDQRTGRWYGL